MTVQRRQTWTYQVKENCKRADLALLEALQSQEGVWQTTAPSPSFLTRSQLKRLMSQGMATFIQTQPQSGEASQEQQQQDKDQAASPPPSSMPLTPSSSLKKGDWVQIVFPEPETSELTPEDTPLDILFEDEHLAVINKPQGLTVHPSATQKSGTLVHALLFHIQNLSGIGGVLRPGIVHRIDKDTSGALVITKSDEAHFKLSAIFASHSIERTYWALCYGDPKDSVSHKVESLIGRSTTDRKKMSCTVKAGRNAVTHYRAIENYGHSSWIEAKLETGRTHQIRVHLTAQGFSLIGDPVYGLPSSRAQKLRALPQKAQALLKEVPGQLLHARTLGFIHPITGVKLQFEAQAPMIFDKMRLILANNGK